METVCSVCTKKDNRFIPVKWCIECQIALCSNCRQIHKQDENSKDHDTLSYSDYLQLPPLIKNLKQACPDHKEEKFLYLCREHDQLICNICRKTKHNKCDETPILKDIVGNVKSSYAFDNVICEMEETSKILRNGIRELQNNLKQIQEQKIEFAKNIENTMDRIMTTLKKVKNNMLSEINAVLQEHEGNILKKKINLQKMERELREIIDQKQSITQHATNLQTYFGIKEMENVVAEKTRSLRKLSVNGDIDNINIVFDQAKSFEMLLSEANIFGEIIVNKKKVDLFVNHRKTEEAQNKTYTIPQNSQLKQSIDLLGSYHYGCCSLPGGTTVVTDPGIGQIKVINPDGILKPPFKMEDTPVDVTAVGDNHVAVSHGTRISMLEVNTEKVYSIVKSWDAKNTVTGIYYRNGHIFFCVPWTGIKRLNTDTGSIENVCNDKVVNSDSRVVVSNEIICYTCPHVATFTALNLKYEIIFRYKDTKRLKKPCGVTVDRHNNVYVAGYFSHNVLVISSDGQRVHQLLSVNNGLDLPTGIHYDSSTTQLIVINNGNCTLCKYLLE